MNESSIRLDLSVNSHGVLLVFTFLVVFLLGSSDISVAGVLKLFLLLDGIKDLGKRISFGFVGVFWVLKSNFFLFWCGSISSLGWSGWCSWSWVGLVEGKLSVLVTVGKLSLD